MFFVYSTSRGEKYVHLVLTLETRNLDSSYSQRRFIYEFTTNNNFFYCKKNCYYIAILFLCYVFSFAPRDFVFPLLH